jgi:hypothetical protein
MSLLVLLPGTNQTTIYEMLSRTRQRIAEHNARFPDLPIQLSLGTTTSETRDLAKAFTIADKQMQAEKSTRKSNAGDSPVF